MIIDIHRALVELYPEGAGYIQQGLQYSGLKWTDSRPKPTEAEIQAKIAELEALEPMRLLRIERNSRLAETDHFAFQDRIMTEEIKTYRQALRDLPKMIIPDDSTEPLPAPTIDQQGQLIFLHWPEVPE